MLGEPIMWSKDPTTQAAMVQFRDEVIWPHIRIEVGLIFHVSRLF